MAQSLKREENIRKLATLAKAEKANLMDQKIKERDFKDDEEGDGHYGKSNVGTKRSNVDRQQEEAVRDREEIRR